MLEIILIAVLLVVLAYVLLSYLISRMVLHWDRQPVPKTPKDYGMDFRDAEFKAADGVKIRGWLIPGVSSKLILITHVGGLTRYGSTKSFRSFSKLYDEEVEFLKVARHLHDDGYWVLMFDFRNHGESGRSPDGGKTFAGLEEYQDVVAAMDYVKGDTNLRDKEVGFVSFCMGANSTIIAMSRHPDEFKNVKSMVAIQPISMNVFIRTYLGKRFSPYGSKILLPLVEKLVNLQSKYPFRDMSPAKFVKDIAVPTMYVQVRNDHWTEMSDIVGFYENTRSTKEFLWLDGLTHRFQAYQYFGDNPEKMLEWLRKWM